MTNSRSDSPARLSAAISLVVQHAQLAAGHGRRQVVEDLDEAAAMVAVVALPAVGADAQDLAVVALGDEADLVAHEVVGLRDRVAHEGVVREGLVGVDRELVLRAATAPPRR